MNVYFSQRIILNQNREMKYCRMKLNKISCLRSITILKTNKIHIGPTILSTILNVVNFVLHIN